MAPMSHLSIIVTTMLIYRSALANSSDQLQTYIVHVSLPGTPHSNLQNYYNSFLPENNNPHSHIIHTYRNVINGFAAKLTPHQLNSMSKKPGFLLARPDNKYTQHTTHTPSFLNLYPNQPPWSTPTNYGKGIIIGFLDGGITPAHPAFNDKNVPPPPASWKGKCELYLDAGCNNKLIGAQNLVHGKPSLAVDEDGHGTHTASTAAGNFVPDANIYGQANGTASGVAPLAHLSIYKVCSKKSCEGADILAGFDAAIEDGVHVISISMGIYYSVPLYEDVVAIGSFAAVEKGIFVSCSAGNRGPYPNSVTNEAPWLLTVGASTTDRRIFGNVKLGNGDEIIGESLGYPSFPNTSLPLFDENDRAKIANFTGGKIILSLVTDLIDPIAIKQSSFEKQGVEGLVLMNDDIRAYDTEVYAEMPLPTILVSNFDGRKIMEYINSNGEPFVKISFKGTIMGADKLAPVVAVFSSRGPTMASPGIVKPDIIGPGVNIVAAWYKPVKKSTIGMNEKDSYYNIDSGTSMSCPHLSGVAALIKSVHPDWSPAMIKSAIMTTATQVNLNKGPIVDERHVTADIFAIGAGHVDPSSALDPGLVYDIQSRDYVSYLCSLYDKTQVEIIVREKISCDVSEAQLNYPSLAVELGNVSKTYTRTVTNVGCAKSTYKVETESVDGVEMIVEPKVLVFGEVNEKITYKVKFSRQDDGLMVGTNVSDYVQGAISWVSADHRVRIPVSVHIGNQNK